MVSPRERHHTSRRGFLAAGGAAVLATGLTARRREVRAQPPGTIVRMNLSDPAAAKNLQSYQAAVGAMLKLPAADPRNWYRNAFVHLLDCPHGNWWFLPWHRGYLGWFEQTCRQLSQDPTFALPYWDWTGEWIKNHNGQFLTIPPAFADPSSVLNPANPAYIASFQAFQTQFDPVVKAYYGGLTAAQNAELKIRGFSTPADLWEAATNMFFPPADARQPNFDAPTLRAVSPDTVLSALAATAFIDGPTAAGFGSDKAAAHSDSVGYDVLEGQPHNLVHNAVGGFMGDMLSPVDPIFFMHHSNIDRLWDVWTRKQQARNLPTTPQGADLATWQQEPFLFYFDHNGQPVPNGRAGDYVTIGRFDYRYQPGFGEQVVQEKAPRPAPAERTFAATLSKGTLDFQGPTTATARVPAALTHPADAAAAPPLFARVTIQVPEHTGGTRFHVLVNPPAGSRSVNFRAPSYAGTFSFFGSHKHGHAHHDRTVTFTVPLTGALRRLVAAGTIKAEDPLRVHVVPDVQGVRLAPFQVPIRSVTIVSP